MNVHLKQEINESNHFKVDMKNLGQKLSRYLDDGKMEMYKNQCVSLLVHYL